MGRKNTHPKTKKNPPTFGRLKRRAGVDYLRALGRSLRCIIDIRKFSTTTEKCKMGVKKKN